MNLFQKKRVQKQKMTTNLSEYIARANIIQEIRRGTIRKARNTHLVVKSLLVPPTTPPICGNIYINRYICDTKEKKLVTFGLVTRGLVLVV